MNATTQGDFITLARVVKTQGRHGEVAAEVHSDVPGRFVEGMRLSALDRADGRRELELESFWPHKNLLVLKFGGVDSISDAETLIGAELQVPKRERARLEPGWNYVSDLIGCAALDGGKEIGRILDVRSGAGEAPLLIIGAGNHRFEVPFAEAYLESVNLEGKEVRMHLPEGMLGINAPVTAEEKQEQQGKRRGGRSRPRV